MKQTIIDNGLTDKNQTQVLFPLVEKRPYMVTNILIIVFVLLCITGVGFMSKAIKNGNQSPAPSALPAAVVTEIPYDSEELSPTPTEEPIVTGDGVVGLLDETSVTVYSKDFRKTALIKIEGKIVQCHGSLTNMCIINNNTIRALQISRANKLVPTKAYPIKITEDEIAPYTPYIDLTKNTYSFMIGNVDNEMKMEFYLKSFSGKQSPLLMSYEGGGVSGYRINSILSSGEVVLNLQGSVYNPGDPLTLEIIKEDASLRKCESREFFSVYDKDFRYYTNFIYNDTNNKQTIHLKQLNLLDCSERVIDTIADVSGNSQEVPLKFFNNVLMLRYSDFNGVEKFKVYDLSNITKAPINFTNTIKERSLTPYGYRADSKTLIGLYDDQSIGFLTTQRSTASSERLSESNAARFFDLFVFVIP